MGPPNSLQDLGGDIAAAARSLADAAEAGLIPPDQELLPHLARLAGKPAAERNLSRALAALGHRSQEADQEVNRAVLEHARGLVLSDDADVAAPAMRALAGLSLNVRSNPLPFNMGILRSMQTLAQRSQSAKHLSSPVAFALAHLAQDELFCLGFWQGMLECAEAVVRWGDLQPGDCAWLALGLSAVASGGPPRNQDPMDFVWDLLVILSAVLDASPQRGPGLDMVEVARHTGRALRHLVSLAADQRPPNLNGALLRAILRVKGLAPGDLELQESVAFVLGNLSGSALPNSRQVRGMLLQSSLDLGRRMAGVPSIEVQVLRCAVGLARSSRQNSPRVNWILLRQMLAAARHHADSEQVPSLILFGLGQLAWNARGNSARMNRMIVQLLLRLAHRPPAGEHLHRLRTTVFAHLTLSYLANRRSLNAMLLRQLSLAIARAPDDVQVQQRAITGLANLCGAATRNCPRSNMALLQALSLQQAHHSPHFHSRRAFGLMLLADNAAANSRRLNGLLAQHLVALATGPTITAEALGYVLRGMACLAYNAGSNPPALNGQLAQALNSMMGFFSADAAAQAELAGALDALAAP
ncbi:hypothetical protein H696_02541 [Fonticula alba]|uniref:Uncharacterized protein n=1 Tax=Fonticula alba TaxID=691883 RepID=A0A058ZCD9_FONAL|nr:hypothetical protein H696_02541 [Fonticula alba]KCV71598.1 hypothetical protein H696_02541 [Fonticula alba]|eukprot:XP_009494721.1 hypothetical protein H696_02541 [Fonticula alba]